jgi:hypothetical protein
MAKNLSRKFATMSEDERRQFAREESEGTSDRPVELDFEEPRDAEHMGAQFGSVKEEFADPEHRDGLSALLDDEQHERAVRKTTRPSEDETASK